MTIKFNYIHLLLYNSLQRLLTLFIVYRLSPYEFTVYKKQDMNITECVRNFLLI